MHAAHPRYRRIYRFTLTNNDKHVTDERRDGDFIFFQPDRVLDGMDRENPERIPARASERASEFDFDFFLRPIKREKEKKRKTKYTILSSSIVAAGFISWFRYFMEAFDTVRCVSGRVCTVDD